MLVNLARRPVRSQGNPSSALRGTVACDAAVLAGGAWSRLFCGNMGIDFPQLKILGSVMRTQPLTWTMVPEHS